MHVGELLDGDALREGAEVRYEMGWDDKAGKHHAVQVTGACRGRDMGRAGENRSPRRGSRGRGGSSRGGGKICRLYPRRGSCDSGERYNFEH